MAEKSNLRQVALVCLAGLLYGVTNGTMLFILPTFVQTMITPNLVFVSLLIALCSLSALIFDLPIGTLSDHVGRKKVVIAGLFLVIPLGTVLPFMTSIELFVVFALFYGAFNALALSAGRALVMDVCPPKKTAEYFGTILGLITLGGAIGVLGSGMILGGSLESDMPAAALKTSFEAGLPNVILFYIIACAITIIPFSLVRETAGPKHSFISGLKKVKEERLFMPAIKEFGQLKSVGLMVIYVSFILSIIDAIVWSYEPLFYGEGGFSHAFGGTLLFVFTISLVVFQPLGGWLADKFGKMKVMNIGLVFGGLLMVIFSRQSDEMMLLGTAFLASMGIAFAWPAVSGVITEISVNRQRGGIAGVWTFFMDLAYFTGPIVGAVITGLKGNVSSVFLVFGLVLLLSAVPTVLMKDKKPVISGR